MEIIHYKPRFECSLPISLLPQHSARSVLIPLTAPDHSLYIYIHAEALLIAQNVRADVAYT